MNRSQRLRHRIDTADAYEDAVNVYFDPVDEEGALDCECSFVCVTSLSGDPEIKCARCRKAVR